MSRNKSSLARAAGGVPTPNKRETSPVKDDHVAVRKGDNLYEITGPPPPPQSSLRKAVKSSSTSDISDKLLDSSSSNISMNSSTNISRVSRSRRTRSPKAGGSSSSAVQRAISKKKEGGSSHSFTVGGDGSGDAEADTAGGFRRSSTQPVVSRAPKKSLSKSSPGMSMRRSNTTTAKAGFRRSNTLSGVRAESNMIFQKMDADKSKSISLEEISEFVQHNEKLWTKLRSLSVRLNQTPEKTAEVAAKVALELATGLSGPAAHEAELTKDQFHQFRKKYMIDPAGHEEFFQRAVFANFDVDGSGELDEEELDQLLETIYQSGSSGARRSSFKVPEMKDLIMEQYDVDGEGALSFREIRGIISGGATALLALRAMKAEEMEASRQSQNSEQDGGDPSTSNKDKDDNEEEEMQDETEISASEDPRLTAARLLEILETPEEAEEAAIAREREELAATASDDEEEEDEEGKTVDGEGEEDGDEEGEGEEQEEQDDNDLDEDADDAGESVVKEEDEEEEGSEETGGEEGEGRNALSNAFTPGRREVRPQGHQPSLLGKRREVRRDHHGHQEVYGSLQGNQLRRELQDEPAVVIKPPSKEIEEKINRGALLRDFSTPTAASSTTTMTGETSKETRMIARRSVEVEDDSSHEFDFCDWLDRKLSPSSYDKHGNPLVKRQNFCQRLFSK